MASFNQITLLGNVGNVSVKTFSNGGKVVDVSLATTKVWKDRDGGAHKETQWHKLVFGGSLAGVADEYVKKGDPLFVTGEMGYRTYEGKAGETQTVAEVRVTGMQLFWGSRKNEEPKVEEAPSDDLPW